MGTVQLNNIKVVLKQYTPNGRIYMLAGNSFLNLRQALLQTITGKKVTKAESGITNLENAVYKLAGIDSKLIGSRNGEKQLEAWYNL